jgi:hypothetical protein
MLYYGVCPGQAAKIGRLTVISTRGCGKSRVGCPFGQFHLAGRTGTYWLSTGVGRARSRLGFV